MTLATRASLTANKDPGAGICPHVKPLPPPKADGLMPSKALVLGEQTLGFRRVELKATDEVDRLRLEGSIHLRRMRDRDGRPAAHVARYMPTFKLGRAPCVAMTCVFGFFAGGTA